MGRRDGRLVLLELLGPFVLFVYVALEPVPRALVQEHLALLAHHLRDLAAVYDTLTRHEQTVDHVRVVVHTKLEVVDDVVRVQIVHPVVCVDVVLLVAHELLNLPPETLDHSSEVWEHKIFRRHTESHHVPVRVVDGHAVAVRPMRASYRTLPGSHEGGRMCCCCVSRSIVLLIHPPIRQVYALSPNMSERKDRGSRCTAVCLSVFR